ncbi:unnamed protein product [Arctia plantaginis]|uniref:Uncharacterized protein n=1 Tax=Arctia plantaginis TaxID=874455 RepID=A0A8S1BFY1_ARCPL|nr:unnamed protein product [Arctia plantaginis]
MDGDVICECPLPIAFSSCTTTAWPSKLVSRSPGRKKRSLRPHSSPIRNSQIKESKVQGPGRSSPGPVIPSSPRTTYLPSPIPKDLFTPPASPGRSIEGSPPLPPIEVKSAVPSNKAYFSSRPPPMPLLLVPASVPSSVAVIFACNKTVTKEPLEQNVKMVRIILQELISALPISSAAIARSDWARADHESNYKHSRLSSDSSLLGASLKCHVATQAHTKENEANERNASSCVSVAGSADEWLGGVRALRDSHVRLMLRQLRHIDRLNRALDRVRYTPPVKTVCADDLTTKHNVSRS